jgi:hypothetical protein
VVRAHPTVPSFIKCRDSARHHGFESIRSANNGSGRLPARWLCTVCRPPIIDTQETLVVSRACMSYCQNFLVCAQTCCSFRPELKLCYHENGSHRIE